MKNHERKELEQLRKLFQSQDAAWEEEIRNNKRERDIMNSLGGSMSYYHQLLPLVPNPIALLMLSHLLNEHLEWVYDEGNGDGWIPIPITRSDWECYGIPYSSQRTARKALREAGLIKEKFSGMPPRVYYKVCWKTIANRFSFIKQMKKSNPENQ